MPPSPTPLHPARTHWVPLAIALGGVTTASGFVLKARGAEHLGTLLLVVGILGTTAVAALRAYQD